MRVSKVKVRPERISDNGIKLQYKPKMVLMQRGTSKGSLIYEGNTSSDRTQEIIPDLKKENFALSILNQTLISKKVLDKSFSEGTPENEQKEKSIKRKALENFLRSYINSIIAIPKNVDFPKTYLSESEIESFMNNRFKGSFEYKVADEKLKAHLSKILYQAFQEKDLTHLDPYAQWMKTYMELKSDKIKKSIINNRIVIDGDPVVSTRMKALAEWAGQLDPKGQLDLSALHAKYETDLLAENLSKVDMKELGEDKLPRKKYEYHRELKLALQFHQKRIFGTQEAQNTDNRDDKQLAIYNLEVVKYLERNFPLKTVKKYTRDYLTHYLKVDTIKTTIARQLENAVRASMLRQGKFAHHELNETTSSTDLTRIKREDAFVMNLITTSVFAANNIRNIVYEELTKDILGKDDFIIALGKNKVNWKRFNLFFGFDPEKETEAKQQETLWALRGAVQQIRNNVNHYKKETKNTIFGINDFEYGDNPKPNYSTTLFQQNFQAEIAALPEALATQLMTGGVLSFYSPEILQGILHKTKFQLCRSVIPFAPGFKKVMNAGIGYQNATKDQKFYDLGLEMYLDNNKNLFSPEAWAARYFLLKLLYNNVFLPEFMEEENNRAFADSVEWLLNKNKKQAADSKNEHAFAFAEVRPMNQGEKIADYMAYIQSHTMLEQSKKEDAGKEQSKKKEADQDKASINFQKFTLQLFAKAFDSFLRTGGYQLVKNLPQPQLNPLDKKEEQTKKLVQLKEAITPYCNIEEGGIDSNQDAHIAFYVYCKLLDANHLSTLRNELIKYHSAANNDSLRHQVEIIELCLVSVDQMPNSYTELYDSPQACLQRLTPFLADGLDPTSCADLYAQSDKETPVVHHSIELSMKYGTQNLLQQLVETDPKFKVTQGNFEKWHKGQSEIESYLKLHQEYHDKWKKEKGKKAIEVREAIGEAYINNCILINNYNWNNKVHFEHLKKLQSLTIEILGRMAGFINLWERDFQYLHELEAKKTGQDPLSFKESIPERLQDYKDYFRKVFLHNDMEYFSKDKVKKKTTVKYNRNFIAHFNYLTSMDKPEHSLLDLINILRKMLHYDRKLRNAVSKAIIELFDKHGMKLELQFDSQDRSQHLLKVKQLVPKKLYHLGTTEKTKDQPLYTNQVSPVYCDMCRALLEMKKQS